MRRETVTQRSGWLWFPLNDLAAITSLDGLDAARYYGELKALTIANGLGLSYVQCGTLMACDLVV